MRTEDVQRATRNILSALAHVDPAIVFPGVDQSERRIRFRDNPHAEFLKCSDDEQIRIADCLVKSFTNQAVDLRSIA